MDSHLILCVFFFLCDLYSLFALRPESDAGFGLGQLEVAFDSRGRGHANASANTSLDVNESQSEAIRLLLEKVHRIEQMLNKARAEEASSAKAKAEKVKAAFNFSADELHAALNDNTKPVPPHMMPSAFVEEVGQKDGLVNMFHAKQKGQILRGVLDFRGYAFALSMDRSKWKKEKGGQFYSWQGSGNRDAEDQDRKKGTWYQAMGELDFKLLRYPADSNPDCDVDLATCQKTKGRHRTASYWEPKGSGLEAMLMRGFAGTVQLRGWWNDATMHFKGEAKQAGGDDANALSWLHHAYIPWERLDMRWDDEGASCRFDFYLESDNDFKDNMFGGESSYGVFRLDAEDPKGDNARIYQGQALLNTVLYATRLRLDQCSGGAAVTCALEMRPLNIVFFNQDPDKARQQEFEQEQFNAKPTDQAAGPWFTYIGMIAYVQLTFKTPIAGLSQFSAETVSSSCWGESPCPSILEQNWDVQILDSVVLMHQQNPPSGEVPQTVFLYPIYSENAMTMAPNAENILKINATSRKNIPPTASSGALSRGAGAGLKKASLDDLQEQYAQKKVELDSLDEQLTSCKQSRNKGSGAAMAMPANYDSKSSLAQIRGRIYNELPEEEKLKALSEEVDDLERAANKHRQYEDEERWRH